MEDGSKRRGEKRAIEGRWKMEDGRKKNREECSTSPRFAGL
jgi:hypothetical protein